MGRKTIAYSSGICKLRKSHNGFLVIQVPSLWSDFAESALLIYIWKVASNYVFPTCRSFEKIVATYITVDLECSLAQEHEVFLDFYVPMVWVFSCFQSELIHASHFLWVCYGLISVVTFGEHAGIRGPRRTKEASPLRLLLVLCQYCTSSTW